MLPPPLPRCALYALLARSLSVALRQVWLSLLAFVLLTMILAWLVDRLSPHGFNRTGDDHEARDTLNFGQALYFMWLTLLGKDTPDTPRS